MGNSDREVLLKILRHADHAISYAGKYDSCEAFENDEMCVEATVFNIMQIGELAKSSLSDELKASVQSIPWNQIYGLRNRIVHGYEGVDFSIVWDTINEDLPEMVREIKKII